MENWGSGWSKLDLYCRGQTYSRERKQNSVPLRTREPYFSSGPCVGDSLGGISEWEEILECLPCMRIIENEKDVLVFFEYSFTYLFIVFIFHSTMGLHEWRNNDHTQHYTISTHQVLNYWRCLTAIIDRYLTFCIC